MKPRNFIILATAVLCAVYSCSSSSDLSQRETLRTLQPLLLRSEKVDSCLAVLRSIDTTGWTRPSDKARYALLHAMALDKNYIDTTDLSVIAPAVEYYTPWRRLNRADKFYTWYYKGRIEENARDFDAALHSYLEAERVMGATDDLYKSRLYTAFGRVYEKTISRQEAYSSFKKALYYARNTGQMRPYGAALCDCSAAASYLSHPNEAQRYILEYEQEVLPKSNETYEYYLMSKIIHYVQTDQSDSLAKYLPLYLKHSSHPDYLSVANGYVKVGNYDVALTMLQKYQKLLPDKDSLPYYFYSYRSKVRESLGDYSGALDDIRVYNAMTSDAYLYTLDRKINNLENQYHRDLKSQKGIFSLIVSIIVLLVIFGVSLYVRRQKDILLRQRIEESRVAYERLYRLLSGRKRADTNLYDNLEELEEVIISIGSNLKTVAVDTLRGSLQAIERVSDARQTLSLVALFAAIHCENTFSILQDKGLDDLETGHCFLLLLGVNTSSQATLLNRNSLKNTSLSVRKKLDIHNQNEQLVDYLRSLLKSK